MKVEFLLENTEKHIPLLGRVVPVHSQVPVLSNILLEATREGFFLSATNLEMGARIKIPAKIEEEGATTVPGKQLIEALSSLPRDKVSLSHEKDSLKINCRNNTVVFQTITKEEFPSVISDKGDKTYAFQDDEIRETFEKLIPAVSQDDLRPELTGILLSQKDGEIDFVATDGFRLSLKNKKKGKILEANQTLIFPSKLVVEAAGLPGETVLYINKKGNQIVLENDETLLIGRLINGEFPNYERVIPASHRTSILLDAEEFLQKLRLSFIFARDAANILNLKVSEGKMKMTAKASGIGEEEAIMEGDQEGEDNEIAFNVKFLIDLLKIISEKTIVMELSSSLEPAAFKVPQDPGFLHIIMPVRVQE
jgi:DNA polymerase-3 subunit beta